MPLQGFVQTLDNLQKRLNWLHGSKMTWRQIAEQFPGVSAGALCSIAKGREPKGNVVRRALGLPPIVHARTAPDIEVEPASLLLHSSRVCDCGCGQSFGT